MNISEATAFNTLMLSVVLEGDNADESLEAAAHLADRANKVLGAGLTGGQVRRLYQLVAAFKVGDRVRIGKGKKVWILKGQACADPCEHWDATVEGSDGYTNQMVAAERLTLVTP